MAHMIEGTVQEFRRYPWSEWTNGATWAVQQGEDFDIPVESFRSLLHGYGMRNGMTCKTKRMSDSVLHFQFVPKA